MSRVVIYVHLFLFRCWLLSIGFVVGGIVYLDGRITLRKDKSNIIPQANASTINPTTIELDEVGDEQLRRWARGACELYRVPFQLYWSLLKSESNLDPGAVSPVGALGIAQIMPETLRTLTNVKTGKLITRNGDAFNPYIAIYAGAEYLARMRQQWGNWYDAVGAYNAGKNGVTRNQCKANYYTNRDGNKAIASYTCTYNRETHEYKLKVFGGMEN